MEESKLVFVDEECLPGKLTAIEAKTDKPFDGDKLLVDPAIATDFSIEDILIDGKMQLRHSSALPASMFAGPGAQTLLNFDRCTRSTVLLVRNHAKTKQAFRARLVGVEGDVTKLSPRFLVSPSEVVDDGIDGRTWPLWFNGIIKPHDCIDLPARPEYDFDMGTLLVTSQAAGLRVIDIKVGNRSMLGARLPNGVPASEFAGKGGARVYGDRCLLGQSIALVVMNESDVDQPFAATLLGRIRKPVNYATLEARIAALEGGRAKATPTDAATDASPNVLRPLADLREYPLGFHIKLPPGAELVAASNPEVDFHGQRLVVPSSIATGLVIVSIAVAGRNVLEAPEPAETFSEMADYAKVRKLLRWVPECKIGQTIAIKVRSERKEEVIFVAAMIGTAQKSTNVGSLADRVSDLEAMAGDGKSATL